MLSIVSLTASFSVAFMISCILLWSSSCRFCVLKRSADIFTSLICTGSGMISPDSNGSSGLTSTTPSCLWRNVRYLSSCCFVSGWYSIFNSNARSTYGPSPNHKISSSQASIHFSLIPALWYRYASSYAHSSEYSCSLSSSKMPIRVPISAPCALLISYFNTYFKLSWGAISTNSW